MKLPTPPTFCLTLGVLALSAATAADASKASAVTITVRTGEPGTPISPVLYGVFYEDVNSSCDGGLYAEMVQNRSFEYYPVKTWGSGGKSLNDHVPLFAWVPVQRRGLEAKLETAIQTPLHPDNPTYVVLTISGESGAAGLANTGYDGGMPVKARATYDFSFHTRHLGGQSGPWTIALKAPDGATLARAAVPAPGKSWAKQEGTLTCARDEPRARLVLTTAARGQVALDMISLFPRDTFKGRKNGLRRDLAGALADLKPRTLRFPGGCIVHGMGLANAYRWKETIGDVAHRRPNFNLWGYHQTSGLGYFEYLQFCEDIGAAPLPVLPCGVSCGFRKPFQSTNQD